MPNAPARRVATQSAATRPAARSAVAPTAGRRAERDNRVVVGMVTVFLVVAVFLMSMRLVTSGQESRAIESLGQTIARVQSRQSEFRALSGRFATWPELRDGGMQLEPRQSVKDWNADASHWFISIRDLDTGVICDRTGELFDLAAGERQPVCRRPG